MVTIIKAGKEKYITIIPAYKPLDILIQVVAEIRKRGFLIIVVDDGSGVEYQNIFRKIERKLDSDVIVLHHKDNLGKGRAIKTGLSYIKENYNLHTVVITMDADGQHSVEDALCISRAALENEGTLVLGSRGFEDNVPLRSRLGNNITKHVFYGITGTKISDTQTGLRAFSTNLIDFMLETKGERYEYEMEILLRCKKHGIPVKEVPIETIYIDGNANSHFRAVRDSLLIYREIVKFTVASFSSFIVDYCCYCLLIWMFGKLELPFQITMANVLSRVVSGSFNYHMNRKYVFNSNKSVQKTAGQYIALALIILVLNTIILNLLIAQVGIQRYLAKVITEVVLFICSWTVQKFFIFSDKGVNHNGN